MYYYKLYLAIKLAELQALVEEIAEVAVDPALADEVRVALATSKPLLDRLGAEADKNLDAYIAGLPREVAESGY